jgi:hypothetical protein
MPSIVGIMMARPGGVRVLERGDNTIQVRRWEPPPPTRPAPTTFATPRPRRVWVLPALIVAAMVALGVLAGDPIDVVQASKAVAQSQQRAVEARVLLERLP